jgi:DNA-binding MarR family transcriptional regulator
MTSSNAEPIGRLIYTTSLNLRNYVEKMLSPYGLTVEQFHLLKNTSATSGLSQKQLCLHLGKQPANITRILDRLEKKRWIERKANPSDRRSSLVFLTAEGERVIDKVSSDLQSYSSWFVAGINDEEERIFRRVLGKIDHNIKKLMAEIDREK